MAKEKANRRILPYNRRQYVDPLAHYYRPNGQRLVQDVTTPSRMSYKYNALI
jgi:hypothetical protein